MSTVAATIRVLLDTKAMSTGVQRVNREFAGLQKVALKLAGTIGAAFSVAAITKDAVNIINNYAEANSRLRAILQGTADEMERLKTMQQALGSQTKFTASEVANAQTELAKLGFTANEIGRSTEGVLNLAAAGGIELARAAEILGGSLRGMGMDAGDANRVVDVMAKGFTSSALDAEKYAEAMKMVAPVANAAGLDIETTTALVGKLSDSMISGSLGGTALKNLLSQLTDSSSDLSKQVGFTVKSSDDLIRAFEVLSKKNIDLSAATQLTDERSKAAFLTLVNGTDSLKDLQAELQKSAGSAKELADTMTDNLRGDIDKAKSAWEGFVLSLEDGEGVISSLARSITQFSTDTIAALTNVNNLGFAGGLLEQIKKAEADFAEVRKSRLMDGIAGGQVSEEQAVERVIRLIEKQTAAVEAQKKVVSSMPLFSAARADESANLFELTERLRHVKDLLADVQSIGKGSGEVLKEELKDVSSEVDKAANKLREMNIELAHAVNAAAKGISFGAGDGNSADMTSSLSEMFDEGVISAELLTFEITKATQGLHSLMEVGDEVGQAFAEMFDPAEPEAYNMNLKALNETLEVHGQLVEKNNLMIASFGTQLSNILDQGIEDFDNFGEAVVTMLKRMARELAATAIAAAVLSALLPGSGGFGAAFNLIGGGRSGFGALFGGSPVGPAGGGGNAWSMLRGSDIIMSGDRTNQQLGRIGR